jgi:hypothetical protein
MRPAACLAALALALLLGPAPARAMTPAPVAAPTGAEAGPRAEAPVLLARCDSRCRAARRAWRRHQYRPSRPYYRPHRPAYRPRPHYHHHHHHYHRRRGDAAAAAIVGGVIGLGIGAAIANSRPDYYGHERAPEFAVPGGGR